LGICFLLRRSALATRSQKLMEIDQDYLRTGTARPTGFRASHEH